MTVAVSRADRRAFSEVSELRPVGPGRFDAEVDLAWTIGGKPNGGYLLAMLGRAGVVLATTGVAALTFGLVKGSDWGWGSHATAWAPAASAALIALFVLHCLRSRTPLIQPSLFRSRSFTAASLVAIFFSA